MWGSVSWPVRWLGPPTERIEVKKGDKAEKFEN